MHFREGTAHPDEAQARRPDFALGCILLAGVRYHNQMFEHQSINMSNESTLFSFSRDDETTEERMGDILAEDLSNPDSWDAGSPESDSAPTNLSAEALNGTSPIYGETPTDLKTKKNVSKLTVVVDPRGLTFQQWQL